MKESMQLEGFFLEFSASEMVMVKKELERRGIPATGIGMKELLLDILFGQEPEVETDTERVVRKARSFLKENPEKVQLGMQVAMNLFKNIKFKR